MRVGLATILMLALIGSGQIARAVSFPGTLQFAGCIGNFAGCRTTSPADALDGANTSALSPNGKQLYVAADQTGYPLDHFTISASGVPAFAGCVGDIMGCSPTTPADALNSTWGVTVSPNGKYLYATSDSGDDLSYFSLDTAGTPSFLGCVGNHSGCTPTAPTGALDDAKQPVVSPNSRFLYVTSGDGALDYFSLGISGTPTFMGCIGQIPGCTTISPATALDGARFVAYDTKQPGLYVGVPDSSDVSYFSIDPLSGVPTFSGCVGQLAGCTSTTPANALNTAYGVALARGDAHLYVTSQKAVSELALSSIGTPSLVRCFGPLTGCTRIPIAGLLYVGRGALVTGNGKQLYTMEEGSNSIAHFALSSAGAPELVDCIGAYRGCARTVPAHALSTVYSASVSPNGRYLYSDDNYANNVGFFKIASLTLRVSLSGTGTGSVTGAGISCPHTCSDTYPAGTHVTLTAKPAKGSTFSGWHGVCTGRGRCTITISSPKSATATFSRVAG